MRVDQPKAGRSIDPVQAREAITAAYLADDPTAVVDLVAAQPEIDDADVRTAVNDVANPAVSGPVTLAFGDSRVRLQPRDFAAALSFRPEDGELRLHVDQRTLLRLVEQVVAADGGTPVDATVALVDGQPEVIPAKPGVTFEPAEVTAAFTAAAHAAGGRARGHRERPGRGAGVHARRTPRRWRSRSRSRRSRRTSRTPTTATPTSAGPWSSSTAPC